MNAFPVTIAGALLAAGLSAPAWAVDILNADDRDYEVSVTENGVESRFILFRGGDEEEVCGICTVSIDGVGAIEASGREQVVISAGRLGKRSG
mgnify:CR=1 FL=1